MIQQIHLHCRKKLYLSNGLLYAFILHFYCSLNQRKQTEAAQVQLTALHSLVSQFSPVQPGTQSQKYPPIRFRQELALTQGLLSHSLASRGGEEGVVLRRLHVHLTGIKWWKTGQRGSPIRHAFPVHCEGQRHLKPLTISWQVPP